MTRGRKEQRPRSDRCRNCLDRLSARFAWIAQVQQSLGSTRRKSDMPEVSQNYFAILRADGHGPLRQLSGGILATGCQTGFRPLFTPCRGVPKTMGSPRYHCVKIREPRRRPSFFTSARRDGSPLLTSRRWRRGVWPGWDTCEDCLDRRSAKIAWIA